MKIYKIKNVANGLNFQVSELPEVYPPEWGKAAYQEVIGDEETIIEHAQEYEIVEEEIEDPKIKSDALAYLASTDWYVVRFAETGKEIPDEVMIERAHARKAASA